MRYRLPPLVVACSLLLALTTSAALRGEVKTQPITYKDGDTPLIGYLAYDDSQGVELRPAILIAPEWRGLDDYAKSRARQFAAMGYVAFALDPYGGGVVASDDADAKARSTVFKNDRSLLRRRGMAGLEALMNQPLSARDAVVAVGYCFGGTLVLELARAGAPLRAGIVVHGGLAVGKDDHGNLMPAVGGVVKAKILALQGGDDPFVTQAEDDAFMDEMRSAHVDWQLMEYGGAVHAFSNPKAGSDPSSGRAYNALADRRSMALITQFLSDLFPR